MGRCGAAPCPAMVTWWSQVRVRTPVCACVRACEPVHVHLPVGRVHERARGHAHCTCVRACALPCDCTWRSEECVRAHAFRCVLVVLLRACSDESSSPCGGHVRASFPGHTAEALWPQLPAVAPPYRRCCPVPPPSPDGMPCE